MSTCLTRAAARLATSFALAAACVLPPASAASIQAELTRVSGNTWDATFTVAADPGQAIESFTVYFDWAMVSNLLVQGSPADWDSLVVQGDAGLASDGFFDALALAGGIADGDTLEGFVARFDWADLAGPSKLRFTVNDPSSFDVLEEGAVDLHTGGGGGTQVPEPGSGGLLLAAMGAAVIARRQVARRLLSA